VSQIQPTPDRLLVMLHDRLVQDVTRGVEAIESGDRQQSHDQLIHAQDIVLELRSAARDEDWARGLGLVGTYDWLHGELSRAYMAKDVRIALNCLAVATQLAGTVGRVATVSAPAAAAAS